MIQLGPEYIDASNDLLNRLISTPIAITIEDSMEPIVNLGHFLRENLREDLCKK